MIFIIANLKFFFKKILVLCLWLYNKWFYVHEPIIDLQAAISLVLFLVESWNIVLASEQHSILNIFIYFKYVQRLFKKCYIQYNGWFKYYEIIKVVTILLQSFKKKIWVLHFFFLKPAPIWKENVYTYSIYSSSKNLHNLKNVFFFFLEGGWGLKMK